MGGPGSGWTAAGGHVPGSQGGKLTPTEKAVYQRVFDVHSTHYEPGTIPYEHRTQFAEEEKKFSPEALKYGENLMKKRSTYYDYVHTDFGPINRYLRGQEHGFKGDIGVLENRVSMLDNYIKEAPPLAKDVVMFRGVGEEIGEAFANANEGDIIRDKAFQSHSLYLGKALSFAEHWAGKTNKEGRIPVIGGKKLTIIRALTGGKTKGIYQDNYGEMEVTVARGTPWVVLGKEVFRDATNTEIHLITVGEIND